MATQTTDQQNALKDAMARAKQIAAKLQQQQHGAPGENNTTETDETRKRPFLENAPTEPLAKRNAMDGVDHTDPKVIAQQVANSLVQRAGLGSMLVEEITIPNRLVGLVIGRGGEMINKLQSESGAKIQVAPDPPPNLANMIEERQITITGTSEAVSKAKDLITEIRTEGKIPERLMGGPLPGEFSIEMNISQGKVGLVIGKGGETIKSLQERAGCKMVLFQDGEYANAPEKPLRISGEQSTVMYGKQLVQDLLTMKELEALNPDKRQEGMSYKEIEVPREAVGFVIGAKGASINQLQMQTGCRVQFKNDMQGETKTAMLTGTPQQLAAAEAKLNEILQSSTNRRAGGNNWGPRGPRPAWNQGQPQGGAPGVPFNGPGGPRPGWSPPGQQGPGGPRGWGPGSGLRPFGGGGHGTDGNTALPPGHKHMVIHVPANKCGLVIGKGGDTLKFIHNETKVNIEINRDVPDNSPIRMFHIRGSDEMIDKALVIIREKINDPTIVAKPADGSDSSATNQNQWSGSQPGGWAPPPQQNQQWNQQNQWQGQQPGWGQQPPVQPDQWSQQGTWNQQPQPQPAAPAAWSQPQPTPQPTWDPQQQQWQQPNAAAPQGQWSNQQYPWTQPGQPYQTPAPTPGQQNPPASVPQAQPAPNPAAPVDPAQQAAPQAQGQPDYSAAWALYYQQQSQYYQQYAMQQPAAPGVSAAGATPSTGAPVPSQTPVTPTSAANMAQPQAMADYQAKLAEYYKSYGQQPPQ